MPGNTCFPISSPSTAPETDFLFRCYSDPKLYEEKTHSIAEICRLMGISRQTIYNYVAEAKR